MRWILLALLLSLLLPAAPARAAAISQADATAKLEALAPAHLEKVARTLRPNAANKSVHKDNTGFTALYMEVDRRAPEVEVLPGQQSGEYIGQVRYVVHEYRSRGKTEQEALNGPFHKAKSRRMREYTHFAQGKWAL